jgi:tetratricopeptide (TPR) repeat protein
MARALMALNETEKAIHLMEPLIDKSRSYHLWNNLVIAYVKTRNFEKLDALLKKAEIGLQYDSPNYLYFLSAYHAQLLEINNEKEKYAKLAIEKYLSISPINQKMLGRSFYILENYDESKKHFESYLESNPSDIFCLSKLASIAFINGKPEIAMNYIDEISIAKNKYDFGYGSYFIGQAYAQGGKYIDAIEHLKEAILRGDRFSIIDYENDPLLAELHKMPEWSEFLDEWKFEN